MSVCHICARNSSLHILDRHDGHKYEPMGNTNERNRDASLRFSCVSKPCRLCLREILTL